MGKKGDKDMSEEAETSKTANEKIPKVPIWDLPDVPDGKLPPHLLLQRTRVLCSVDAPIHITCDTWAYASVALGLGLEQFRSNFRAELITLRDEDMEFDMIGIDPSLANAFDGSSLLRFLLWL